MPASIRNITFFGTPSFSVAVLDALEAAGRVPTLVVCQPSKVAGRGQKLRHPPVAQWALDRGVELAQPKRVRSRSFLDSFRARAPDIAIVVAFGQIFPQELLDIPKHGCVNLHASLLPRHRGAAPISAAIAAGDRLTGACTMVMEAGLDTGPVLLREQTAIGPCETTGELTARLAVLGGILVVRTLDALERGELVPEPQDDERSTYAPQLEKGDGDVDWQQSASQIDCRRRAYDPWPGLTAMLKGRPLKLVETKPSSRTVDALPGELLAVSEAGLEVACGAGSVLVLSKVQRPGKRVVSGRDFFNGERPDLRDQGAGPGDRFAMTVASEGDANSGGSP